ncbi:hypothetical protein MMC25_007147 [Agyrium rufum]|nr:hypothetical protein [Agyrium rufum]
MIYLSSLSPLLTLFFVSSSLCGGDTTAAGPSPPPLSSNDHVIHLTLERRGGPFRPFTGDDTIANLTRLQQELRRTEERFTRTKREVKGNKLVRKADQARLGGEIGYPGEDELMAEVQRDGTWFTKIFVGDSPQETELDVDLLTADFFVLSTSSQRGSYFEDYFSKTYPSLATLGLSGSILGLAPSRDLAQIDAPGLLSQLLESGLIKSNLFSILIINDHQGLLTLGETASDAVNSITKSLDMALQQVGSISDTSSTPEALQKREKVDQAARPIGEDSGINEWEKSWKWSKVQGAAVGWWQILMQGVLVNGDKILRNQPAILDLSTPLILAPPPSARTFYASIPGAYPIPSTPFYAFPCLHPPTLHFEFEGWPFPAMRGWTGSVKDRHGKVGGRFSLGRVARGSGFCVGAVVESRVSLEGDEGFDGARAGAGGRDGNGDGDGDGDGDGGAWVLGERWFWGVGAVFDFDRQQVGFRTF